MPSFSEKLFQLRFELEELTRAESDWQRASVLAKASTVFAKLLKRKRGFSWDADGEALLRQHKPGYFDGTQLPRTVVLSGPLSKALQDAQQ